MEKSLLMFYQ